MDITNKKDLFWILIAALWLVIIGLGTTGHHVIGLVLCVPLMWLHMILGFARKGVVTKRVLVYPFGVWAALFAICFILNGYFADKYAGVTPPGFLGLHPSFAPVIFLYFLGGVLTISLGFYLRSKDWMTQEDWDAFCAEAKKLKEEN